MCLAESSWGLSGDKGMRGLSPLSRLDPASWAELGQAVLVPMAHKRVGCGDLGMQGCRSAGTHICRDMEMQEHREVRTQDLVMGDSDLWVWLSCCPHECISLQLKS